MFKSTAGHPDLAKTELDYILAVANQPVHETQVKNVKIIASIGPACDDPEILEQMIGEGMDAARIMIGTEAMEVHAQQIQNIKIACNNYTAKIGRNHIFDIAADIRGAELRIGTFLEDAPEMEFKMGSSVRIMADKVYADKCDSEHLYVEYDHFYKLLKKEQLMVFFQTGVVLKVVKLFTMNVECEVLTTGKIKRRQSFNIPGVEYKLPNITEADKEDIAFAVDNGLNFFCISFVRSAEMIREIKDFIRTKTRNFTILAKIENQEGMKNLVEILQEVQGVMVARKDLGMELSLEKIFLVQKQMVSLANQYNVAVCVCSQLMESMVSNYRPTRSEASDVACSVVGGADMLCLSSETQYGSFPVESVRIMAEICKESDPVIWHRKVYSELVRTVIRPIETHIYIAIGSVLASIKLESAAIIVVSSGGRTPKQITKFKPKCPVLAVTKSVFTARSMILHRGLIPILYTEAPIEPWIQDMDNRVQFAIKIGMDMGILKIGDSIVVVTGWMQGLGYTNTMRMVYVPSKPQSILF